MSSTVSVYIDEAFLDAFAETVRSVTENPDGSTTLKVLDGTKMTEVWRALSKDVVERNQQLMQSRMYVPEVGDRVRYEEDGQNIPVWFDVWAVGKHQLFGIARIVGLGESECTFAIDHPWEKIGEAEYAPPWEGVQR